MLDMTTLVEATASDYSPAVMSTLRKRRSDFASAMQMQLMAIAVNPQARGMLEDTLDRAWRRQVKAALPGPEGVPEIIIGGGLHAAIYAAARAAKGYVKPLVLERSDRVGGIFAISRTPSFMLNSRNRPGEYAGLPSENAALNVVPGAPVQVAHMSSGEFSTNADLAFVIRTTLAMYADVRTNADVQSFQVGTGGISRYRFKVILQDGRETYTDRVLDARGLGEPIRQVPPSERVRTLTEHLATMDQPFPLRGIKRVAVVGGGDSARVAAESLLGVGPTGHMSVPALDWVEQVDLYGNNLPTTCDAWRASERGRYQALGSFLRPLDNGVSRLRVFAQAGSVAEGLGGAYVNSRFYDLVITATGWIRRPLAGLERSRDFDEAYGSAPSMALQYEGEEAFAIGPAADLPFDIFEGLADYSNNAANRVALFRLGSRTASFAANRTGETEPREVVKPVKSPVALTERVLIGSDSNGEELYTGDRVRVYEDEDEDAFSGFVVADQDSRYGFAVDREDGVQGGGPGATWNMDSAGSFYKA